MTTTETCTPSMAEASWQAVVSIKAILMWRICTRGCGGWLNGTWHSVAPAIQQMGPHDVYVATDPSGTPLFFIARLLRDVSGLDDTVDIREDNVYTIVSIERRLGRPVSLDYDAPITATVARQAFAWTQQCGADTIVIGDLATHGTAPMASIWLLTTGRWWWEDVLPVVAKPWREGAAPVSFLRTALQTLTWGEFLSNWYKDPFHRPQITADASELFQDVFKRCRVMDPAWVLRHGNMIYDLALNVPGPYSYICVWRRGVPGRHKLTNPVISQFETII